MNLNEIKELLVARVTYYLEPYFQKLHHYSIKDGGSEINVIGATDDTASGQFVLVHIFINEESKKIFISNINLPDFMRHQGVGRKLIKVIYKAATELRYELFIVSLAEPFYDSLKKRGAMGCENPRMLKVVDGTMLE
jgi:hypothetical protein